MRNQFIFIAIVFGTLYSQCDSYTSSECYSNSNCEWVESIESVTCASLVLDEELCEAAPECTYSCDDGGGYFGWCTSSCYGGMTYIDNGYCIEVEVLECSEMDGPNCNIDDSCEWVENFEMEWCSFDNAGSCNSVPGCNWGCDSWYTWLCGCEGQYQVDYSYCNEIESSECSEMNQQECSNDDYCNWVSDVQYGSCSQFDQNSSACEATLGCYGAYQYPGWYSGWYCAGGSYEIDNSYCEEVQYLLGDINSDSSINVLDIIEMVNLILEGDYNQVVDMNYDNRVNVLDIILVVDMILGN